MVPFTRKFVLNQIEELIRSIYKEQERNYGLIQLTDLENIERAIKSSTNEDDKWILLSFHEMLVIQVKSSQSCGNYKKHLKEFFNEV